MQQLIGRCLTKSQNGFWKIAEILFKNNLYVTKACYKYRLKRHAKRLGGPALLVYQMGKVGSSTIKASLNPLQLQMPVYHVHFLGREQVREVERFRRRYFRTEKHSLLERPWMYEYINENLKKGINGKKWKVISLTRDPIARNISAFFENLEVEILSQNRRYQIRSDIFGIEPFAIDINEIDRLHELFFSTFTHDDPLTFFDVELNAAFDMDIFSYPFPKAAGYQIINAKHSDVMIIKLEQLNQCAHEAFQAFLGIDRFEMRNANLSKKKNYNPLYREFLRSIHLPQDYIARMYESKFANHFYGDDELNQFKEKWQKNQPSR